MVEIFEATSFWPTTRELGIAIGNRPQSMSSVTTHLRELVKKGYADHGGAGKMRGYRIIRLADGRFVVPRLVPIEDPRGGAQPLRPEGWSL